MCDSNNMYYRPQPHEFVVIRADGTRVHKGDKVRSSGTGYQEWDFVSCTHPRKIFVEYVKDPSQLLIWPNRTSQEFYPSVFGLGIWDATDGKWTFEPEWPHDDIAPGYDIRPMFDKLFNNMADKLFPDKEAETDKTDMWARIDQSYQRVTKCDGTVILTPKAKADETDKPWVTPGPSESEIAAQADRVRRADTWVETGVWEKSDNRETYTHEDAMRDLHEAENANSWVDSDDSDDDYKYRETDIADDDDKAELVRESDEQRQVAESYAKAMTDKLFKSDIPWVKNNPRKSEETDKDDGN